VGDEPEYDEVRKREYSTFGDALRMRKRSPQVFAAGAQYALDRLLANLRYAPMDDSLRELVEYMAARVLEKAQGEGSLDG
jgi:hypothetical protein